MSSNLGYALQSHNFATVGGVRKKRASPKPAAKKAPMVPKTAKKTVTIPKEAVSSCKMTKSGGMVLPAWALGLAGQAVAPALKAALNVATKKIPFVRKVREYLGVGRKTAAPKRLGGLVNQHFVIPGMAKKKLQMSRAVALTNPVNLLKDPRRYQLAPY